MKNVSFLEQQVTAEVKYNIFSRRPGMYRLLEAAPFWRQSDTVHSDL